MARFSLGRYSLGTLGRLDLEGFLLFMYPNLIL